MTVFKKASVLFLSLLISCSLASSCQNSNIKNEESKNLTNNIQITETDKAEWKTAYLDLLKEKENSHLSYALVYIDGDDIPELYLSGIDEATGDSICSYKNGGLVEQKLNRIGGGFYIEKDKKIANQNGNMGQIYTHVYELTEDGFIQTFEAVSSERVEFLENGEYNLHKEYSIGDKTVSEAEYNDAVNAAFDFEKAVRLYDNTTDYDTVRKQITEFN